MRVIKTAKRHLKKAAHLTYHKRVDPQLPDQSQPTVLNPNQGFSQRFKDQPLLILIPLLVILLAILGFYLWQTKAQPIKPVPLPENKPIKSTSPFPPPTAYQKGPFFCPGIPEFCKQGQDILIGTSYIGLGGKLPANSLIYASFDGAVTSSQITVATSLTSKKTQKITALILTDKAHLLRAAYYFKGTAIKNRPVKEGEVIATTSGEPIPLYQNSPLIFVLTRNDPAMGKRLGGETVRLNKGDFK